jgi:hypothetical protein
MIKIDVTDPTLYAPLGPVTAHSCWRPTWDQRARLVKAVKMFCDKCYGTGKVPEQKGACEKCGGTGELLPQAAEGEIVRVRKTLTPPGFWYTDPGTLWITHWGGVNGSETVVARPFNGTAGFWEEVECLALYTTRQRLDELSSESRIDALVTAVKDLKEDERRLVLEGVR